MTTIAKLFGVDFAIFGLNVNVSKPKSQTTIWDHCKYVINNAKKISLREENA